MVSREGKRVVVVIPTYNSGGTLEHCVESVLDQTLKPTVVIIVDNASTDGSVEAVQKLKVRNRNHRTKVKVVRNKSNLGVTGGRNRGIKEAGRRYDYIFFFDHDMVADRKMLVELVKVAESGEQIGIVTPKIYFWEDKKRIWSAGTGINLWTGQVWFRGGKDVGQYERAEEVEVAPAAILAKQEVLGKLKEFDGRYFATYEDTDFCFRAKRGGWVTYYAPRAVAYHKIPVDEEGSAKKLLSRAYWVGRNRVIFMRDFGRSFGVFLVFVPMFSVYYFWLALRQRDLAAWGRFIRGTVEGFAGV